MTPSERLKRKLSDETLVHELGHLVIGLELGLHEGGIEFPDNVADEVARAHYNNKGATPKKMIIRGLAGMYCQALLIPNSIAEPLRTQILEINLFANQAILENHSPVVPAMRSHGFIGDWLFVVHQAKANTGTSEEALRLLQRAHANLASLTKTSKFHAVMKTMLKDLTQWLVTDDEDLNYAPTVFYSINRAEAVWQAIKA